MADISITATSVVKGTDARVEPGIFGAAVAAGEIVYKDASANDTFKLADADSGTAGVRVAYGMALNGGAAGQTATVQTSGDVTVGAVLTVGEIYVLSSVAGKLCPKADLDSGEYVSIIGVAVSTSVLRLHIKAFGVAPA